MKSFCKALLIATIFLAGAPLTAVAQDGRNVEKSSYEDLWKSTCEINPDIQFVVQKLSSNDQCKEYAIRWLALRDIAPGVHNGMQPQNSLDNFLKGHSDKYEGFDARTNF